jgi:3-hydroxyisobutyrate dehydrogenase-like beta-hydroxyacid dehydrogenase
VRQALMGGFASSRILEVHGERMIKRTFDPGFRIELHQKDSEPRAHRARKMGVSFRTPRPRRSSSTLRRARRQRVGPLRHGPRAGDDGEFEIGQKA